MSVSIGAGERERSRAIDLQRLGFKAVDASHVACAESARADVLLTTDDGLLRKASKHGAGLLVRVANPLSWLQEVLET